MMSLRHGCLVLAVGFFGNVAWAGAAFVPSAHRAETQDWRAVQAREFRNVMADGGQALTEAFSGDTAYSLKGPFADLDLSTVPEWPSLTALENAFLDARNRRFLVTPERPDFSRRISWLYPDDGCFARASQMRALFARRGDPGISKLFIMGNLTVATANHPDGEVHWGWHVVPVARVGNDLYVFDPAIDPAAPLPAADWALHQVTSLEDAAYALCAPHSYHPYSACVGAGPGNDDGSARDQERYLGYEWERQDELGRDPEVVLGDSPPWQ